MDNIEEFLYQVMGICIFCIAISLLILQKNALDELLQDTKKNINGNATFYEQHVKMDKENQVEYKTIIGYLMSNHLEYDIEINGTYISVADFNSELFPYDVIPNKTYSKKIIYNENGEILKIKFQ